MTFSVEATLDISEKDKFDYTPHKEYGMLEDSGYVTIHLSCDDPEFCSEVCVTINVPTLKKMMNKCGYEVNLKSDEEEQEQ